MRRNALISSTRVSFGGYVLASVVIIALARLAAPNLFWHTVAPLFASANALSQKSRSYLSGIRDAASLSRENERLTLENSTLSIENETLRGQLQGIAELPLRKGDIVAGVLVRPPESPYDTLLLEGGSRAGITEEMTVFGPGTTPIGAVTSVSDDFSRVTLFSSYGTRIPAVAGRAQAALTLMGTGAGTFSATVPRSSGVAAGDTIFLGGPGDLPLGKVVRVDDDPESPAATLRIAPVVNPFTLSWVLVRDTGRRFAAERSATTTP